MEKQRRPSCSLRRYLLSITPSTLTALVLVGLCRSHRTLGFSIAPPNIRVSLSTPYSLLSSQTPSTTVLFANSNNHNESSALTSARNPPRREIPANLRRKVVAKRPALGHVVPESSPFQQKGGKHKAGGTGVGGPSLRPQGKARAAGLNNPSMLKISAGTAKGRRLDSPDVFLRPMMGKVREAVFSTFTSFGLYDSSTVNSLRHLDIFAGSGSVGLESLSRGASHCTFVDLSDDCCATVERNLDWCQFDGKGKVVCADALQVLNEPSKIPAMADAGVYQLVTLCPPYEEVVYGDLLEGVANSNLVTDDTIVLVEYPVELGCLPHVVSRFDGGAMIGVRNRRYGRTVIAMYIVNPTGKLEVASSRPEEFVEV